MTRRASICARRSLRPQPGGRGRGGPPRWRPRWRPRPIPTAAAFFDVDNTIIQGASIFHLARGLHRRKFFTTREIAGRRLEAGLLPRRRGRGPRARRQRPRARRCPSSPGHRVEELEALGEEIFDESMAAPDLAGHPGAGADAPRPGAAGLAGDRGAGRDRRTIARRLGLTGALGTVAEHVDGVYTGAAGRRHAARSGQGRGDRGAGRARRARPGALHGLLRLLQRPADAVAWSATRASINPDHKLRDHARRRRGGGSATTAPGARRPGSGCSARAAPGAAAGTVAAGVAIRRKQALTPPAIGRSTNFVPSSRNTVLTGTYAVSIPARSGYMRLGIMTTGGRVRRAARRSRERPSTPGGARESRCASASATAWARRRCAAPSRRCCSAAARPRSRPALGHRASTASLGRQPRSWLPRRSLTMAATPARRVTGGDHGDLRRLLGGRRGRGQPADRARRAGPRRATPRPSACSTTTTTPRSTASSTTGWARRRSPRT